MSKSHENQVDTLVSQLNGLKIKTKNSEILRKEEVDLNNKLASLQELFYLKLYEIKVKHEKLLQFSVESQTQFEKQKVAQSSFDNLKAWEIKGTSLPKYYSILYKEEKIQIQASLDSWHINFFYTKFDQRD